MKDPIINVEPISSSTVKQEARAQSGQTAGTATTTPFSSPGNAGFDAINKAAHTVKTAAHSVKTAASNSKAAHSAKTAAAAGVDAFNKKRNEQASAKQAAHNAYSTQPQTDVTTYARENAKPSFIAGILQIIAGILVMLVGIPLLLLPGPGILTIGAGACLVARGIKTLRGH